MNAAVCEFRSYRESVREALDSIGAHTVLAAQKHILIKPNLINASPHPVTTPPQCCEAIIDYIRNCSGADVVIGEGCGDASRETDDIFSELGYTELAARMGVALLDLNCAPMKKYTNPSCTVFPEIYLPETAFTHFIVSVPVLKAHTLAAVSGSRKNMMGFAPPRYYAGKYGVWKKAVFHANMQQSIIDLNTYRTPDLTVMDATVGLAEYHLGGPECSPPANKIFAGCDAGEVDRLAAQQLGLDWRTIGHIV